MKRKMKLSPDELARLFPTKITNKVAESLKKGDLVVSMSSTTRPTWVRVVEEMYYDSGGKVRLIKLAPIKKLVKSIRRGKRGFQHWGTINRVDLEKLNQTTEARKLSPRTANGIEGKIDDLLLEVRMLKALMVAGDPSLLPRLEDIERTMGAV